MKGTMLLFSFRSRTPAECTPSSIILFSANIDRYDATMDCSSTCMRFSHVCTESVTIWASAILLPGYCARWSFRRKTSQLNQSFRIPFSSRIVWRSSNIWIDVLFSLKFFYLILPNVGENEYKWMYFIISRVSIFFKYHDKYVTKKWL